MSRRANERYRSIFTYSPDPVGVIRDGVFVDCNRALLNMLALKDRADFIGQEAGDLFSPPEQADGEASAAKAKGHLQRCIAEGRFSFPWTSRRVNGDLFSSHVLLQTLDDSDSPAIAIYLHDVSRLTANNEAAFTRKAYLHELLECSPVAYVVSNLDNGRISKVNRAGRMMLGLSDRAWHDIQADELLAYPSDRFRFLRRLIKHGEAHGEIELKRTDGTRFPAEVTWRYNPGSDKELLCWGVDITEFKQTEQALELSRNEALRANEAKSEFLSRMSHELRTPLNAILGFGQLLQMNSDNFSADQTDAVNQILSGGEHLLELIKDVLDFSRVNSGHLSLNIQTVSTDAILQRSLALIRPLAEGAGVSLATPADTPPDVMADPHWLQQVMVNLLSNAVKYNRRGGSVTVSSEASGEGMVRIHVRDSGKGIHPRDRHRLFKPFERFSTGRPEIAGTGIGLALCKQLIELMGGSIAYESEPGKGSDFWFELRMADGSGPTRAG